MKKVFTLCALALGLTFGASEFAMAADSAATLEARAQVDIQMAPLKSVVDVKSYMAKNTSKSNPLNALSPAAQTRFLASLTFGPKGLAAFQYADLDAELTLTQAYRILALFGAQRQVALLENARVETDLDQQIAQSVKVQPYGLGNRDYKCSQPGECQYSQTYICSPDACPPVKTQ